MRYYHILFIVCILFGAFSTLNAQVTVKVNSNIDSQPIWGPAGYDYVEYYYLPDIETYYNVSQHRYYYYNNGRWTSASSLPSRYSSYDFYKTHKIVLNEPDPWKNHKGHKAKYASYKNRADQEYIRDSNDSKYFKNKKHPNHHKWVNVNNSNKSKHSDKNKK
jgi:hypothetical protein